MWLITMNKIVGQNVDRVYQTTAAEAGRHLENGLSTIGLDILTNTSHTVGKRQLRLQCYAMSANVASIRRKYISPPTSKIVTAAIDTQSTGPGAPVRPRSAQRKPSTTPAIGFSPNNGLQ